MPFADKFRAMMNFPFPGDEVAGFVVDVVDVGHESGDPGGYVYPIRLVLRGAGGQSGVQRALKALLPPHTMTFSAYGNPYQLWFGKPQIEALGDRRYAVTVKGGGARVFLADELERFLAFLAEEGYWAA